MDRQALGEAAGTSALDATAGAVDPDPVPETATPVFPRHRGLLLSEYGGKRYYEHGLVGALGQKVRDFRVFLDREVTDNVCSSSSRRRRRPARPSTCRLPTSTCWRASQRLSMSCPNYRLAHEA